MHNNSWRAKGPSDKGQSLPVGAVQVIFMTVSKHGDKQTCSISQVSFLSESPTPNGLPKHLDIIAVRIYSYVDSFKMVLTTL